MPEPAIAPQPEAKLAETYPGWARVQELTCELTVELPVPGLRVRDLIGLERDLVIASHWLVGSDIPLRVNGQLISWGEFEVVGQKLAVRLTELA